ncbi:cysteine peptidase family C39 domain-containing protein [Flavobacterium chungnamense]|uniref:Peptidase C39 domain-containing protein n=1 Tax=Flavobacterium chungnamense TaxID=706182 RepID=A0ABP7UVI3_9FLAO
MINNVLLKYIVQTEQPSDGGLESLLKVIKFYNGTSSINNLNFLIQKYYPKTSYALLNEVAKNSGLIGVICKDIELNDIIEYNHPIIIKFLSQKGNIHYVLFNSFSNTNGFHIWDSRKGYYSLTKESFEDVWFEKDCLAFIC